MSAPRHVTTHIGAPLAICGGKVNNYFYYSKIYPKKILNLVFIFCAPFKLMIT